MYSSPFGRLYQKRPDIARRILLIGHRQLLRICGSLVLATNPIFPAVAVETRLGWVGLTGSDFDLVTTYENSRSSKPNPAYYQSILSHTYRRARSGMARRAS